MAESKLTKFKSLLAELFMFDNAELDFGIYRIMNAKRSEITKFLDEDLLPQVRSTLSDVVDDDRSEVEAELKKAVEQAKSLGIDPNASPKVKELQEKFDAGFNLDALESEIFSNLYDFFRRYYHEGDFMSLRRYKAGVYAIPYEGEEVYLHWANKDQYYIKTSEYFRDYTFKLPDGRRVHFKITSADTEKDNVKAQTGKDRRFILNSDVPVTEENGELIIRFEYRPDEGKRKQETINAETIEKIIASAPSSWKEGGGILSLSPTEANPKRTIIEKRLTDYTARYTFDYFIHKDLGGFLRRELDFYIKNEVLHIDDIENETPARVRQYLTKIRAIRKIAHKIIDFLAQLEDFQKKLWLKKKFVVETNYCVTLDRVPEELYAEIVCNDAQRQEWIKLFAIDEITGDLAKTGYSMPLTVEFLKANPFLVLDTKFFSEEFKNSLLSGFDDLDEQTDGLIIHSENFQALNLLQERYKEQVKCIYIDPPYNTGNDGFVYKDSYQHSSWISMLLDRLTGALALASEFAVFFASIDENEVTSMRAILDRCFGSDSFESQIIVQSNKRGQTYQSIAKTHEYLLAYVLGRDAEIYELPKNVPVNSLKDENGHYELWELRNRNPKFGKHNRPNLYYPIYVEANKRNVDGYANISLENTDKFCFEVLPKNSSGEDSCWRWGKDKVKGALSAGNLTILVAKQKRDGGWNIYEKARKGSTKAKSIWSEIEVINEQGTVEVGTLGFIDFGFPKPTGLIKKVLQIGTTTEGLVIDFFGGSGTTAHAVINLNREDGGKRKYILVEMGEYFDTVLKPRIQKVIYSKDWRNGKPISREGGSHIFKYLRLESYEDALNNLELSRTAKQQDLLETNPSLREDYMLRYMLDVEAKGSASLLNIDRFQDPFSYKLKIASGSVGETREANIDLVETFNYLIGLRVKHIDYIRGFKVVQGNNPAGEKVLIIWRNTREKTNADLDEFFLKQKYNTRDMEFDSIYVNGDNNLENLKRPDETWKVRLIEEEFFRLMFDVRDV